MIAPGRHPAADSPRPAGAEAPARRALAAQVARLERELTDLSCSAWPRTDLALPGGGPSGRARVMSLG